VLTGVLVGVLAVSFVPFGPPDRVEGATTAPACEPGAAPFAGVPGADLVPEVHESKDQPPVRYVRWRGHVPSFDGMPLSVDVTVPCDVSGTQPTVVMAHGFTDDKTIWQETGKSDTVRSIDRPGSNDRWNNIWFASRGYVVLNYTARGWRDSCGPDQPGHRVESPAPECASYDFWIHLDDKRWEVRDAQWLTGGLVQSGIADADRLAITGGSYGGGPASMAALLADRIMCGAAGVPADLGPDPCDGAANGDLVPWTTPDGTTPLTWAASLPLYTFGDLIHVLAPNGRFSDGWDQAPPLGDVTEPFGVPLESTLSGLLLAAGVFGSLAPPGVDPDADITGSANRMLAGNPFPPDEPAVIDGIRLYREFKSPITITPQGRVPIFWVQGFTDALFPGWEALAVLNHVRAADPDYPFTLFLGDLGHDYAAERQDEWDLVKEQMNDFIDHYLRPDRTPEAPPHDVGATFTRCLEPDAPMRYVRAADWHDLHRAHVTFESDEAGTTSTEVAGPAGAATDPISTATLGGYKGCRAMQPSEPDPTVVTYEFPVTEDLDLLGGPVVDVAVSVTGPDVPLAVRVWDVAADRTVQGLVTRGVYRMDATVGDDLRVTFQLAPQGYTFRAGHVLKVEVTANDSPYLQASNVPAEVAVTGLSITLPIYTDAAEAEAEEESDTVTDPDDPAATTVAPGTDPPATPTSPADTPEADEPVDGGGGVPAWIGVAVLFVVVFGVSAVFVRRRARPRP
jgi:predicted acyl esterase